jgi:hypothetical protein
VVNSSTYSKALEPVLPVLGCVGAGVGAGAGVVTLGAVVLGAVLVEGAGVAVGAGAGVELPPDHRLEG